MTMHTDTRMTRGEGGGCVTAKFIPSMTFWKGDAAFGSWVGLAAWQVKLKDEKSGEIFLAHQLVEIHWQ